MKRGVGAQFNWIFALVAGGLFLSLLIGFGVKYIGLQEKREAYDIAFMMDDVISGLVGVEMYRNFSSPYEFELDFSCDRLWVNKLVSKQMRDKVIFAGRNVTSDNLLFFTKSFEVPFKVRDLIYVVDMNKDICYFGDDSLKSKFPEPLWGKIVNRANCDIVVRGENVLIDDVEVYAPTDELKMGAIVAGDARNYGCSLENLRGAYETVKGVYVSKASLSCQNEVKGLLEGSSFGNFREDPISKTNTLLLQIANCEVVF